jgi:hypothetical protein
MKKSTNDDFPRWLKIVIAIFKNWKETVGSVFVLITLYLWYFNMITQDKAIFGLALLIAGGFVNSTFDFTGLFRYLGKNKSDENNI